MCQPSWHINDIFFAGFPICTSAQAQAKNSATFSLSIPAPPLLSHCHPSPVIARSAATRQSIAAQSRFRPKGQSLPVARPPRQSTSAPRLPRSPHKCASLAVTKDNPHSFAPKDNRCRCRGHLRPPAHTAAHGSPRHTLPCTAAPGLSISNISLTI